MTDAIKLMGHCKRSFCQLRHESMFFVALEPRIHKLLICSGTGVSLQVQTLIFLSKLGLKIRHLTCTL